MRESLSLFRREFSAYFLSPIAYVVLAVFLAVTGHLFYLTMELLTTDGPEGIRFPMVKMLGDVSFWLVFLFIPPLLTMRLFAEERSTGTLEMLVTTPLTDWQIVLCKFLAAFAFYCLMWVPTLLYLPALLDVSWSGSWWQAGVDPNPVVTSYLGLALAGAMFLALGLFVSNLVRSQMVSALISLALGLMFIVVGIWKPDIDTGSALYRLLYYFSVPLHFERGFARGIVDTRHLVLYLSLTVFFLFVTVRSLESRRWR
jgi:ABC-2 type transport system permease protein